jgi:hypothetical protein
MQPTASSVRLERRLQSLRAAPAPVGVGRCYRRPAPGVAAASGPGAPGAGAAYQGPAGSSSSSGGGSSPRFLRPQAVARPFGAAPLPEHGELAAAGELHAQAQWDGYYKARQTPGQLLGGSAVIPRPSCFHACFSDVYANL